LDVLSIGAARERGLLQLVEEKAVLEERTEKGVQRTVEEYLLTVVEK
jgi:hypothetical protein